MLRIIGLLTVIAAVLFFMQPNQGDWRVLLVGFLQAQSPEKTERNTGVKPVVVSPKKDNFEAAVEQALRQPVEDFWKKKPQVNLAPPRRNNESPSKAVEMKRIKTDLKHLIEE